MYSVTTRRLPAGQKSANGTSFVSTRSVSLMTSKWLHDLPGHGATVSRLQIRNIKIMMADPTVTAVTSLEV